jgi:hypothetical protein
LNNKSKINTSKGKMYLTVVAMASLLVMAFNLNSNMNAHASIFENIQNVDDVGQSLECVIVVVGCDAQGSVGSSGDVNIGVGDNDTTTTDGDTPLPPIDPTVCEGCLADPTLITAAELSALAVALGLEATATIAEICVALDAVATVEALVVLLGEAGLDATAIVDLLACLEIDISLDAVLAILV